MDLPYEITCYEPLKAICKGFEYMNNIKKTRWTFFINHLPKVISLIGKGVEFSTEDEGVNLILDHCPNLEEQIYVRRYKGNGRITVRRTWHVMKRGEPEIEVFKVSWQQQKNPVNKYIPIETVEVVWNILMKYKKDVCVPTHKIAELYCNELRIARFNRNTGSFDWGKFFGTRAAYFKLYSSIKVLEHFRLVVHKKSGFVIRIEDNLEFKKRFEYEKNRVDYFLEDF